MLKSMAEAHFRTLTPPKPLKTNFNIMSNILLRPPREVMCKIWLESIWPLRICACVKKHGLCGFFLLTYLSIYLSARFFVGATGHSFMAILTLNGSNDVIPQPLVPFGGHINNDRLSACCDDWQFGRLPTDGVS